PPPFLALRPASMRAARGDVHRERARDRGAMSESRRARESHERTWGRNPFEALVYLAAAALLRGLALLPLSVLHRLSGAAFWVVYRVVRLRRGVVRDNLRRSFPDAAPDELDRIAERCYRNHCDVAFEGLKLAAMSAYDIRARVRGNLEIGHGLFD